MESDDDIVRDEFYSTLAAHDSQDPQLNSQETRTSDSFDRQGFEICKQNRVKPSTNPTHDKKYWGKRTSRKKLEKLSEIPTSKVSLRTFAGSEGNFSDVDSEVGTVEAEGQKVKRKRAGKKIEEPGLEWDDEIDEGVEPKPKKKCKLMKTNIDIEKKLGSSDSENLAEDELDSENGEETDDLQSEDSEREDDEVDVDNLNISADDSGNWEDIESENELIPSGKDRIKKNMKNSKVQKSQPQSSSISFFSDASNKQQGSNQVTDAEKGAALKKQLSMWEKYFQLRVMLQTALQSANEIHPSSVENMANDCPDYEETIEKLRLVSEKFLAIAEQSLNSLQFNTSLSDISSLSFEEQLAEMSSILMTEGPDLMQFWHDKIMLSMGKHSQSAASFSTSSKNAMTAQIEGVLADRQRLLKRTRTPRVEYKSSTPASDISDGEIYDEYDFYQSLIKDLISSKSAVTGQYLTNSDAALRLKSVKSITTQLVRKHKSIVYDIHAKLVGFTAPRSVATDWRDDAIDALTLSVFNS